MNLKIFWFPLLLLLELSVGALTYSIYKTINTERANLGTPLWVLSRAGDRMPNKNYSKRPLFDSFDKIQPFINWNGVIKMVVPTHGFDGMSDPNEFHPEVYNWNTLPSFVNDDWALPSCNCCDDGGTPSGSKFHYFVNRMLQLSITISPTVTGIIGFILILLIIFLIISTCSRCRHTPYCQNLQEDESSSSSSSCDEHNGRNVDAEDSESNQ